MPKSSHNRSRLLARRRLAVTIGVLTAIAILVPLGLLPSYWIDLAALALAAAASPQADTHHTAITDRRRHHNRTTNQRPHHRHHNGQDRRGTE
ncbi:hypothetical protein [Streptomyces malaysiensis]|uniref:hypothetical protein n=1 Tax=Streptomyces malaysiensis TaxID=92644 RepID=UPI000BFB2D0B|nr:hypothetical protein [Streptomyces malaysiensis]ATL88562.1 hypothetical protein SMALA_8353 [Streptomyces malaysiensis]QDL68167.1 hypothetical protein DNK48_00920 [Streptomyces malaysiensis]